MYIPRQHMASARRVRHDFKSRTLWLKSIFKAQNSLQNMKSVFKTKTSFQNTNQFSNHKSSSQTQINAQIHKISFEIVNTNNYKSVKLRFLSVISSLLNATLKFNICRRVLKQFAI